MQNNTYFLLIDTSSNKSLISLNKNDRAIDYLHLDLNEIDLCTSLFPSIKNLLEKNNINKNFPENKLSFLAIGTGPGSYTGLRVGASAAKALAYGLNIPLIGFCSLKSFVPPISGSFVSIIDAKSGGLYILEATNIKNNITYIKKPTLIPLSETQNRLKNLILVSPQMNILKQKIDLTLSKKYFETLPNPDHLAKICFYKYENKNFNLSNKLELLYLRGPKPLAL